jgi:prepilin-type N-terminal cleavage/methylation domain-containing protein
MNFISLQPKTNRAGFSLLEVIVAAAILGLGLLSVVRVFPYGVEVSQRAEDVTQATLLAKTMFEGLKMDPVDFPIIPGAESVLIPIPGNGYDDDTNNISFNLSRTTNIRDDLNNNLKPDIDFDGTPEADSFVQYGIQNNNFDDDGDGVVDDNGDSYSASRSTYMTTWFRKNAPDGDIFYDPEPNLDEEFADGKDNDRDGLIDEDCRLGSVRVLGRSSQQSLLLPLLSGDNTDNDGDGEYDPERKGLLSVADGIDNNGDGRIDEGIDEEIWNGLDDDRDGMIDEDCRLAAFPFSPAKFPSPFDRYGWQIRVGRIPNDGRYGISDINGDGSPDLGNGIDDDGDGLVDEELPDGIDFDFQIKANARKRLAYIRGYSQRPTPDGLIDEDCVAAPLPNWRRVEILITWGGDGEDNDGDLNKVDPKSTSSIGSQNANEIRRSGISYGGVEWGIDEEKIDGIDNDFDGEIDEDTYRYDYLLVGFIHLKNPSLSFVMNSGQPRGLTTQTLP